MFLDLFDMRGNLVSRHGLHPHSGIATLTHLFEGSVRYEDTIGATGILPTGRRRMVQGRPRRMARRRS